MNPDRSRSHQVRIPGALLGEASLMPMNIVEFEEPFRNFFCATV